MYLRFTPAWVLASLLSAILVVAVVVRAVNGTIQSNVFIVALELAATACWLYVASGRRREREKVQETDRDINALIRQLHR